MGLSQVGIENYLGSLTCGEAVMKTIVESNLVNGSDDMLKVSSSFRRGMGMKGDLCGCLLSAISLIGLKYGRKSKEDDIEVVDKKVAEFYDYFQKKHRFLECIDLTREFLETRQFNKPKRKEFCSNIVQDTVNELEVVLKEN